MARTPSVMIPLGTALPLFRLPDTVSGQWVERAAFDGMPLVVCFICNHCPYVHHIEQELIRIAREFQPRGIRFLAISANDAGQYPEDLPEEMRLRAERLQYPFPYLYDESQEVARAFDAACTPDFFVYDRDHRLYYHGQLDASRPKSDIPVTGSDLRNALGSLLQGIGPPEVQAAQHRLQHQMETAMTKLLGVHCSIGGGLQNAFTEAAALGIDTFQIFTQNQRQWINKSLSDEAVTAFKAAWKRSNVRTVFSHCSYLINLASEDPALRKKSVDALTGEVERCQALGLSYCVLHPGAGQGAARNGRP